LNRTASPPTPATPDPDAITAHFEFRGHPALTFAGPSVVLTTTALEHVRPLLAEAERYARAGHWVAGFVSYEAAPAFDSALEVLGGAPLPLAWFAVFDEPLTEGTRHAESLEPSAPTPWTPDLSEPEHRSAAEHMHAAIGAGEYYQANLTFRLHSRLADARRAAWELYRRLRENQPDAFAAYLRCDARTIVSASPELFFARTDHHVVMQPMKGTARRGRWEEEDERLRHALEESEKDLAENLMIVDLIRSDLGRIAETGSVRVERLCAVEPHPTVWQMTSTVSAEVAAHVGLPELFTALFPCGSVVGAPKVAAARAIATLERSPRGVYCGAIGFLRPGGDATFSVAIRTATVSPGGDVEYGVGGGIVWDSRPDLEYDEALAKGQVLTASPPRVSLIETLRLEDGRYPRLDRHLRRLASSARYFGLPDATVLAQRALHDVRAARPSGCHRVRVVLHRSGTVDCEATPFVRTITDVPCVRWARRCVDSASPLVYHKTTGRELIDAERARYPDAYDVLFTNERGEVTEFGTGNVVIELNGALFTPSRDSGLLAGVFREELLERALVRERVIHPADVEGASRVWLVNSLREWVAVRVG
jgi:para-aminobenzoate synthetase / 4-amino-4-deoxychorismate lyase